MKDRKLQSQGLDFRTLSTQPFTATNGRTLAPISSGIRNFNNNVMNQNASQKVFKTFYPEKLAPMQKTYTSQKPFLFSWFILQLNYNEQNYPQTLQIIDVFGTEYSWEIQHNPPKKYKGYKVANTGIDPHGNFLEFIRKDIIKNIDVHRDSDQARDIKEMRATNYNTIRTKWAIGCTKETAKMIEGEDNLLPRFTMKRSTSQFQPIRLKTDVISFRPPEKQKEDQKAYDQLITTPKYNFNSQTSQGWLERTYENKSIVNRSSVNHNIITHADNDHSSKIHVGTLNSKILFRKKAICDFANEAIPSAIHINNDYKSALNHDNQLFKKYTGICTNVYDAAHRFGIDKPFKV